MGRSGVTVRSRLCLRFEGRRLPKSKLKRPNGSGSRRRFARTAGLPSIAQNELEASYSHYLAKMDRVWSVNYD